MTTASLAAQEIRLPPRNHALDSLYFSLSAKSMEFNLNAHQLSPSMGLGKQHSPLPTAHPLQPKKGRQAHLPSPCDADQLASCFQRLSVFDRTSARSARPLPPLPSPVDQVTDIEVELFNSSDDSSCLVPESRFFRYGAPGRQSCRDWGRINYAYFESSLDPPEAEQPPPPPRDPPPPQRRLRRCHSGPAGAFYKPSRPLPAQDRPELPPPLPPRPHLSKAPDCCRWSAEASPGAYQYEDRPPKVPPREPLSRTPSPKSLPSYINGVMPPTQSFAPDPNYTRRGAGLQRQHSEGSPCILPIMENGRKVSATHYFLLPQRPACVHRLQELLQDKDWKDRPKAHADLV